MTPPPLKLYNTLTRQPEDFQPIQSGQVKMYVCGPTVYDAAHLGHARCYITWDVLYRTLAFLGYQVTYARNVTDVDDKILARAEREGCRASHVASTQYQSFLDSMASLHVLPPTIEPMATHFVGQMIQGIEALIAKGHAYVTPTGTVYFRVGSLSDYGKLSRKPLDDLQSGARVESDPDKESPLDFALWRRLNDPKSEGPDYFDSPWGRGLPGWHMECSTMIISMLGEQIDIHAGGSDLIFPHHENEIAQSEAWTGHVPFAKTWLHNGFVNVSGEKMSKSLGNFTSIDALRATYSANAIRYFLLTNHYRMPVDFSDEALNAAQSWADKFKRSLNELEKAMAAIYPEPFWPEVKVVKDVASFEAVKTAIGTPSSEVTQRLDAFVAALGDDLNSAKALALVNQQMNDLNRAHHQGQLNELPSQWRVLQAMLNVLGFAFEPTETSIDYSPELIDAVGVLYHQWVSSDGTLPSIEDQLTALVDQRVRAKQDKNWAMADGIRQDLTDAGIQLLDTKDGTVWELIKS
jgi:cysteinyl-tRNA synthetase